MLRFFKILYKYTVEDINNWGGNIWKTVALKNGKCSCKSACRWFSCKAGPHRRTSEILHRIAQQPVHSLTSVSAAESLLLPSLSQTPQILFPFLSHCISISNWNDEFICHINPDWCFTGPWDVETDLIDYIRIQDSPCWLLHTQQMSVFLHLSGCLDRFGNDGWI